MIIHAKRKLTLIVMIAMMIAAPMGTVAQDRGPGAGRETTPVPASPEAVVERPADRLDLAAMALDSLDIPPELSLFFETYYDFEAIMFLMIGETIERDVLEATGLTWYYQSSYSTPNGSTTIRSYLEEYTSEDGAVSGFELLENESTFVPDAAFIDELLPDFGDGPAEVTIGSFGASVPDSGPDSIDITFRVGRIVAGVGMDALEGIAVDRELAEQLANRLLERVTAVIAGQPVPAIDTSIPDRYIGLGSGWFPTNEGYWTLPDLYGPGVDQQIVDGFLSGYFRASTYDPNAAGGFPMPRVAIEIADFSDVRSALFLISDIDTLRPVMESFNAVPLEVIPGSSVTLAWEFPNQFIEGASTDSMRIMMLVGTSVVSVEIQGNGDAASAREAAVAIATAQADCMQANAPCPTTSMPADLFVTPAIEEPSNPVG